MDDKVYYKVLLVDDNKSLGASLLNQAERNSLDLRQCVCWEEAKQVLDDKSVFLEWDAIILDANCIDKKGDSPDLHFLTVALNDINRLSERYGYRIPWYVLTAGGKEDFRFVVDGVKRIPRDDVWGEMLFFKDTPANEDGKNDVDLLFKAIEKVAPLRNRNKITHQYNRVFNVIREFFESQSENIMIDILSALHFPEENKEFKPVVYYNSLRQMVEYLFRAANKIGLLPDVFFDKKSRKILNIQQSSLYLAGYDTDDFKVRFGEKGEYVFPPVIANTVKNLLSVTNAHSHTTEINKEDETAMLAYYSETKSPHLLFGYALQLCEVIIWFGNYAKTHNDREFNLAKNKKLEVERNKEYEGLCLEYEGKSFLLEQDEKGNLHCGYCLVSYKKNQDKIGKMVVLKKVGPNQDEQTKDMYQLFAYKVDLVDEW